MSTYLKVVNQNAFIIGQNLLFFLWIHTPVALAKQSVCLHYSLSAMELI